VGVAEVVGKFVVEADAFNTFLDDIPLSTNFF
jgi:hypothetical protein